jgi:cytochrome c556
MTAWECFHMLRALIGHAPMIAALAAFAIVVDASLAQPPTAIPITPQPASTTKQLMETTITDASNAIWNAFDPPAADEQWTALETAAQALIDSTKLNAIGGTGPKDKEWAAQPAWKPFNDAMLLASEAALKAVRAKNHEALLAAGDQLYTPCEGCHLVFNPGVANQN